MAQTLSAPVDVKDGQREIVEISRPADGSALIRVGGLNAPGQVDLVDGTNPPQVRITLDANDASIAVGGGGENGVVTLKDDVGTVTITLDADGPRLIVGGFTLEDNRLILRDSSGREMLRIDANTGDITLGANGGANAEVVILNSAGDEQIRLDGDNSRLTMRDADGDTSLLFDGLGGGRIAATNPNGDTTVELSGADKRIILRDDNGGRGLVLSAAGGGRLQVMNSADETMLSMDGNSQQFSLRDKLGNGTIYDAIELSGSSSQITMRDGSGSRGLVLSASGGGGLEVMNDAGETTISVSGENQDLSLRDKAINGTMFDAIELSGSSKRITMRSNDGTVAAGVLAGNGGSVDLMNAAGETMISLSGEDQSLTLREKRADGTMYDAIVLDGTTGDIKLRNADGAEEFEVEPGAEAEPGTVMVIGESLKLRVSEAAHDRRVIGIVAGAGEYRPGIVLGSRPDAANALPIALFGRVMCKVDAYAGPIGVGDLLTSSETPGHAMRAENPTQAFGAVIGKALGTLENGRGLIPVLVALQ